MFTRLASDKPLKATLTTFLSLLIFSTVSIASAPPYVGGYGDDGNIYYASYTLMETNFKGTMGVTDPFQLDEKIHSLLSFAGAKQVLWWRGPSGWIYQTGTALTGLNLNPDRLIFTPHVWYGDTLVDMRVFEFVHGFTFGVDYIFHDTFWSSATTIRFNGYIKYSNGQTDFKYWNYTKTSDNPDQWFMVGASSGMIKYKHLQFGAESVEGVIETSDWVVKQWNLAFYDVDAGTTRNLKNMPAYVTQGSNAWITYIGSTSYRIGGDDYTGANAFVPESGTVEWYYDGTTTIPEGAPLW